MDDPFFDVSQCSDEQLARLEAYRAEYRQYREGAAKGAHGEPAQVLLAQVDNAAAPAGDDGSHGAVRRGRFGRPARGGTREA